MQNFIAELKRRNVFKVAIAYAVVAWLVIQISATLFPTFGAPEWILKVVTTLLVLGFPVAILFAWAFELTPDGVRKTTDVDPKQSITPSTGKTLNFSIIGVLAITVAYLLFNPTSTPQNVGGGAVTTDATADVRSIAVLPFVNMSSNKEHAYFADGLTEEILNSLAKAPDLLVTARTTVFGYKDTEKEIPQIARELNVAHVLEGSVRRGVDKVRVTAQLIRASDGNHLWSETFDGDIEDIIGVQEGFAVKIAQALKTAMDPKALAAMVSTGTRSVEAYEHYLQGLAFENSFSTEGDDKYRQLAYEAFEHARGVDTGFAKAHYSAALYWEAHLDKSRLGGNIDLSSPAYQKKMFDERIIAAINTAPNNVDPLYYLAIQSLVDNRPTKALGHLTAYREARPNDPETVSYIIGTLNKMSRFDEARDLLLQHEDMALNDVTLVTYFVSDWWTIQNYGEASEFAKKALEKFPNHLLIKYQSQRIFITNGELDAARALVPSLVASDLAGDNITLVQMRDACSRNDLAGATALYEAYILESGDDFNFNWLSLKMLNRHTEAKNLVLEMERNSDPYAMMALMAYEYFEPMEYASLRKVFAREGITPRAPKPNKLACNIS